MTDTAAAAGMEVENEDDDEVIKRKTRAQIAREEEEEEEEARENVETEPGAFEDVSHSVSGHPPTVPTPASRRLSAHAHPPTAAARRPPLDG